MSTSFGNLRNSGSKFPIKLTGHSTKDVTSSSNPGSIIAFHLLFFATEEICDRINERRSV